MYFDEAFQTIGTGLTQRCSVGFLSFAAFAEGFITSGAFFLSPHKSCEFSMAAHEASSYSVFLIGIFFGTLIIGATSDVSGRRYSLSLSLGISFVSCIAVCADPAISFELALLALGFGIGGVHVGCRVFLFELVPMNNRGRYTVMMDFFSVFGILSALLWARYFLSDEHYLWPLPFFHYWRLFYFSAAVICLWALFFKRLTFYSPRQMLAHQRIVGTIVLMKRIFALNQCKHETSFPVTYIEPFKKMETRVYQRTHWSSYFIFYLSCIGSYILEIIMCPYTVLTSLFFVFGFTIFDNIVLTNGLLSQRVLYGVNRNLTIGVSLNETLIKQLCNFSEPSIYAENIYLALIALSAVCLLATFIDYCPRNIIIWTCSAMCGIFAMILASEQPLPVDIASVVAFITFHTMLVFTLNVVILESYPTMFRSTAFAMLKIVPNMISVILVEAAEIPSLHVFGMIAYLLFVTMVLSFLLKNKNRQPIEE